MPLAMSRALVPALLCAIALGGCSKAEVPVSFSAEVRPLLETRCGGCHAPGKIGYESSGLSMASHEALMQGTKFGAVVIPGDALSSALTMLIEGRADPSIRMPHGDLPPLSAAEQLLVRTWVEQGARNN